MLHATGGAVVPSKSFWYLVDFTWTRSEWRYKTIDETPDSIWMTAIQMIARFLSNDMKWTMLNKHWVFKPLLMVALMLSSTISFQ